MNLLIDVPLHVLYQKINNKQGDGRKECRLKQFSVYDLLEMIGDGNCAYTKQPFKNLEDVTFERVNPNRGYVRGNVVMVSKDANSRKSSLDAFVKTNVIPTDTKIKLMRKALYQLEKELKQSSLA